jgi:signal transduction histidine kinase
VNYSADIPGIVHIDMAVPLIIDSVRFGTILFRINAETTLLPGIQSWPTPSESSETFLFRVERDSIVYLNQLRHLKNAALSLKKSLKEKTLPSVWAASGNEGFYSGIDYRGVPVIAYIGKVPGSPWYIMAKSDREEIFSPLHQDLVLILTSVLLFLLLIGVLIAFLLRSQRMIFYKELSDTKDKFFTIISHDLRSPFASIKGFSDLLVSELQKNDTRNVKRFSQIIQESSLNAINLLKNLTEWSRIQTNRITFNPENFNFSELTDEIFEFLKASALFKSVSLKKNMPSELRINADRQMISSVMTNLVTNAIKFSRKEGEVIVSAFERNQNIIVEVKDNGIGMKKEILEKLFAPGQNFTTKGTYNEQGTGLGLAICKEIIEHHGGGIWVESKINEGSKFLFTLPACNKDLNDNELLTEGTLYGANEIE